MRGRDDHLTTARRAGDGRRALPLPERVPAAGRRRGLAAVVQGVTAPCLGLAYMTGRPGLWHYGLLPVLLNLLISLGVLVGFLFGVKTLSQSVHEYFATWWGGTLFAWASLVALVVAAVAAAAAAWFVLQGLLCDFFYTRLARRVELELGAHPSELREVPFWLDLLDGLVSLTVLVVLNVGLLVLHCVPVAGSLLAAACSLLVACWVFGLYFMRFPLVLRGRRRGHRGAFARRHPGQTLGMGAVVFACNLLPVVNAVLLTGAVVGAVLLHRELAPGRHESEAR
jgi:CysZ protein